MRSLFELLIAAKNIHVVVVAAIVVVVIVVDNVIVAALLDVTDPFILTPA